MMFFLRGAEFSGSTTIDVGKVGTDKFPLMSAGDADFFKNP
jgi:hypothetical protein